jgi:hypothetical protein
MTRRPAGLLVGALLAPLLAGHTAQRRRVAGP